MKICRLSLIVMLAGAASVSLAGDISGRVKARGLKHSGNAVVYIERIAGQRFAPPKEHATMDQKNLIFIPHVLPVLAGTTVDFLNSDDVLHNVFSPDECVDKFNLGTWPRGQVRSYTFKRPDCAPILLCNVHPEMEAYVVVLQNPYGAVSATDGSYEIKSVPAGHYTLRVWHEKLKGDSRHVTVGQSGQTEVNFELRK